MPTDLPPPATTVEAIQVRPAALPPAASEQGFSVITLDQNDIANHERLDQALGQVPGVVLFRRTDSLVSNPTTQGISLRSIGPTGAGRALVTLDGAPVNDPFGGWVIWAGLPSELIGKATIVRGGGAGPYGAGALTGVISLTERTDKGLDADVRASELGGERADVVDVTTIGQADVLFGASAGHSDGFIPVRTGRGAADTPTNLDDWSVNFRAITDFAEGRLAFAAGAFDQNQGSGLDKANAEAMGQRASLSWARNPAGGQLGYRLQGWVQNSNLHNSSVSVPTNRASTTLTNSQFDTPATGYGLNAAVRGDSKDHEWEVGVDSRIDHGEDRELFSYTLKNGPFTRYAGGNAQVSGLYAEGAVTQGMWLFTGGVRVDQWSDTNGHRIQVGHDGTTTLNSTFADRNGTLPTARGGIRRNTSWGYVRTAAYMGFRAPTLNELYRPFRVGNINTESNAALTPERLSGVEVGAGGGDKDAGYDLTLFYNTLADPITNVTTGTNARQRQNAGPITARGLESQGWIKVAANTRLRGAFSYVEAHTSTGLRPAETSPVSATAGLDWTGMQKLDVNLGVRYEGARYDDDLNTIKLRSATVSDIRVTWDFGKGVQGYVSAENAFDEAVQSSFTSGATTYAAPRVISVGLTLKR